MRLTREQFSSLFFTIVGILWISVLGLDWSRLFSYQSTGSVDEYLHSRIIKLLLSCLITAFVFASGKTALGLKDYTMLRATFALFTAAEVFFFTNNSPVGIALFSLAQVVFTIRNCSGLKKAFGSKNFRKSLLIMFLPATAVVCIVNVLFIKLFFIPHSANPLFPLIAGYSFFLCVSLSAAFLTRIIGNFSVRSSRIILIGGILFYLGDLTVGLNLVTPKNISYILSTSCTWLFYLPAITLFALSGQKQPAITAA